jgi:hypothetical protein
MTVHHADFALPIVQNMNVRTSTGIAGRVIALGWWVDPDAATDVDHEPTGTLYLVVDPNSPRPLWVPQADLVETTVTDD